MRPTRRGLRLEDVLVASGPQLAALTPNAAPGWAGCN
jgi:hypothetical protein